MDKTTWILDKVWETNHEVIERYNAAWKLYIENEDHEKTDKYEQLATHAWKYLGDEIELWDNLYTQTKNLVKLLED